ncbi:MAG: hypothetical protein HOP29_17060 [Phycisphaerales bacterium]|nr:hypothetical protein [Phycisphaerales bacterium]
MRSIATLAIATLVMGVSARGAVTFDRIAREGDTPPGRSGVGFVRLFGIPSINDGGVVVFRGNSQASGGSNSAAGLYVQRPGEALDVLVDTTQTSGVPTFAVPGQPAGTNFGSFKDPIVTNSGDVLFFAGWAGPGGGGEGFYATTTTGGAMVKIVDTTDAVPGFPASLFKGFSFSGIDRLMISANDAGEVVFFGRFDRTGFPFESGGLYGTSVAGGTPVRLVDNTGTMLPVDQAVPFQEVKDEAAINGAGFVVFEGGIASTPSASRFRGIFAVPVAGTSLPKTVAIKGGAAPGTVLTFADLWARADVNDAGTVVFRHKFGSSPTALNGLYAGTVTGGPLSRVVDTTFAVPGKTGVLFADIQSASINASGEMGFLALDADPIANNGGMHATSVANGPPTLLINTFDDPPPGRVAPAVLQSFQPLFDGPPINDDGNIALAGAGADGSATLFGLYFYSGCDGSFSRIADDLTASADLSGTFGTSGDRRFAIHTGVNTRRGHLRSLNNGNDVAFFVSFSNFAGGIYVAHVAAGGGGTATITCPADAVLECPEQTTVASNGTATAADGCTGASIPVTSSDVSAAGCGVTETITRTWSADDGSGGSITCDQTISVNDTIAPTITCPADVTMACDSPVDPGTTGSATAGDACDAAAMVAHADVVTAGSCADAYVITRTWTATDACGNAASCDQTITVIDIVAPTVSCPVDVTVACDSPADPGTTGSATADDVCDAAPAVSHADATTPGACDDEFVITRTWTATDACGNAASCNQAITVTDDDGPVLTVDTSPVTIVDVNCSGDEPVSLPPATAVDDCDDDVTITSDAPAALDAGETTTVTITASDDCGNDTSDSLDVAVKYGAKLRVRVHEMRFSIGHHPVVTLVPIVGAEVVVFNRHAHEFCGHHLGWWHGWHWWRHLFDDCEESPVVNQGVTGANGIVEMDVPPGHYLVVARLDLDDNGEFDHFIGHPARNVTCGETEDVRLRLLVTPRGKKLAAKCWHFTGSDLLVAEPDMMIWDEPEQEYPFGFEAVGDWGVNVSVAPPEGFVADHENLGTEVDDEVAAVQFTVTEVGSDLVPTQTAMAITHNGRRYDIRSKVGIRLTPDYALSRGFDVNQLRRQGLIHEKSERDKPSDGKEARTRVRQR